MLVLTAFGNFCEDYESLALLKSRSIPAGCPDWSWQITQEKYLAWDHKGDKKRIMAVKMSFLLKEKLGKGSYCQAESEGSGMEAGTGTWRWVQRVRGDPGGEVESENKMH